MIRRSFTIALVLALAATTSVTAQPTRATALRGIAVSSRGGEVVVTISGVGALPRPRVGVLDAPPRIYLDFANVTTGSVPFKTTSADAPVWRVRVGSHPGATRVVIDLATTQPHRVEMEAGSVNVVIGRASAAPAPTAASAPPPIPDPVTLPVSPPPVGLTGTWTDIPPVPALSAPPIERAPPTPPLKPLAPPSPAAPTAALVGPPPPAADLERYRKQAWGTLDRLRLQQPLLISLDAGEPQTPDRVQMAVAEFERLKKDLAAIKPPETLANYHAMLVQSSTLGVMAFTLRLDAFRTADATTTRNASSAAAGAVLLLDRACAVLQCPRIPGR